MTSSSGSCWPRTVAVLVGVAAFALHQPTPAETRRATPGSPETDAIRRCRFARFEPRLVKMAPSGEPPED